MYQVLSRADGNTQPTNQQIGHTPLEVRDDGIRRVEAMNVGVKLLHGWGNLVKAKVKDVKLGISKLEGHPQEVRMKPNQLEMTDQV